jgi:hypothetical protein
MGEKKTVKSGGLIIEHDLPGYISNYIDRTLFSNKPEQIKLPKSLIFKDRDKIYSTDTLVTKIKTKDIIKFKELINYLGQIYPGKFIFEKVDKSHSNLIWRLETTFETPYLPIANSKRGFADPLKQRILETLKLGDEHFKHVALVSKGYCLALGYE